MAKRDFRSTQRRRSLANNALKRGVVPIRRKISPESYEIIEEAQNNLLKEIESDGGQFRIFRVDTLAVTVIGLSRFSDMMLARGPKTRRMVERVPSCREPVAVKLGELSIFGVDRNPKVGFRTEDVPGQASVRQEVKDLEVVYADRCNGRNGDYGFLPEPGGIYVPHCTIGRAYEQVAHNFDPDSPGKHRYDIAAGVIGETVVLQPVQV